MSRFLATPPPTLSRQPAPQGTLGCGWVTVARGATVTTSLAGRRCPPIDRGPVDRRRDAPHDATSKPATSTPTEARATPGDSTGNTRPPSSSSTQRPW